MLPFLLMMAFLTLLGGVGYLLIRTPPTLEERQLKLHAYYTSKAAKAARKGREGVANVYIEAAQSLKELDE